MTENENFLSFLIILTEISNQGKNTINTLISGNDISYMHYINL